MDNATVAVGWAFVGKQSTRTRITAMIAALLLVLALFALVQHDTSPAGASPVAATVAVDHAQLNVGQIICSTVLNLRNAFANTPFGGFVTPILNALLAAFGCAPS